MRKVMQTVTGLGGNCEGAVLATLLGIDIETVPSFWTEAGKLNPKCPIEGAFYQDNLNSFLKQYGYRSICVGYNEPNADSAEWVTSISKGLIDCPICVNGISPRGYMHSVIYLNGELFHDPHPEGGGVIPCQISFIVPIWKGAEE